MRDWGKEKEGVKEYRGVKRVKEYRGVKRVKRVRRDGGGRVRFWFLAFLPINLVFGLLLINFSRLLRCLLRTMLRV